MITLIGVGLPSLDTGMVSFIYLFFNYPQTSYVLGSATLFRHQLHVVPAVKQFPFCIHLKLFPFVDALIKHRTFFIFQSALQTSDENIYKPLFSQCAAINSVPHGRQHSEY